MKKNLLILLISLLSMATMAFASYDPKRLKITEQAILTCEATTSAMIQVRTPLIGPLAQIVSQYQVTESRSMLLQYLINKLIKEVIPEFFGLPSVRFIGWHVPPIVITNPEPGYEFIMKELDTLIKYGAKPTTEIYRMLKSASLPSDTYSEVINILKQSETITERQLLPEDKKWYEEIERETIENEYQKMLPLPERALLAAIKANYTQHALDLLDLDIIKNPNIRTWHGKTPLMLAIENANVAVVEKLLGIMTFVDEDCPEVQNIVKLAKRKSNPEILKMLFEAGYITSSVSLDDKD